MGTYEELKNAIAAVIKNNNQGEITGDLLQETLLSMVNNLGRYATFVGIATPETNPGTPDQNVFYFATQAGTYANFNALTLAEGEAAFIINKDGNWSALKTGIATKESLSKKQDALVSGQNIKTINNQSLLGSGNINIQGGEGGGDSQIRNIYTDDSETSIAYNKESYEMIIAGEVTGDLPIFTLYGAVSDTVLSDGGNCDIYISTLDSRVVLSLSSEGIVTPSSVYSLKSVLEGGATAFVVTGFFQGKSNVYIAPYLRGYVKYDDSDPDALCEVDVVDPVYVDTSIQESPMGMVEYNANNKRYRNLYSLETGELLKHEEITIGGLKYSEERTIYGGFSELTEEQKAYNVETYNKLNSGESITINVGGAFFDVANINETFIYLTKSVTFLVGEAEENFTVTLKLNADGTVESFNSVESVVLLYVPTVGGTLPETRKQSNILIPNILQIKYIKVVTNSDIPYGLVAIPIGFQDTNQVVFFFQETMYKATVDFSTGDVVTSIMGTLTAPTE